MGCFEKFTLFCVVTVIASVSVILIGSVQLMHRLDDGINRDNSELLQNIGAPRNITSQFYSGQESNGSEGPLLTMIIRSWKHNYALRRTIRRTWAREDPRVMRRFVLRSGNFYSKHPSTDVDKLAVWFKALQHRETVANPARYVLFVNESVFVNTPLLLEAIERFLPKEAFILCTPVQGRDPERNVTCNTSNPILVSMDVVRGTAQNYAVHDGRRLYLNRRETEALVRHQLEDVSGLTYFFTSSLLRLSTKTPLARLIDQLWSSMGGYDTPIAY